MLSSDDDDEIEREELSRYSLGQFDEFGNPLDASDSDSLGSGDDDEDDDYEYEVMDKPPKISQASNDRRLTVTPSSSSALVLTSASSSSGLAGHHFSAPSYRDESVEVLYQEEDSQPISEPIIPKHTLEDDDEGEHSAEEEEEEDLTGKRTKTKQQKKKSEAAQEFTERQLNPFMFGLLEVPSRTRHACFLGSSSAGKTSLLRMAEKEMISPANTDDDATKADKQSQAEEEWSGFDSGRLNKELGLTTENQSLTGMWPALGKQQRSYALTLWDTPGHRDFTDELIGGLVVSDGCCVVIDLVEGVVQGTRKAVQLAVLAGKTGCILVLNKYDRLILELKLPPADAYHKINSVLADFNALLSASAPRWPPVSLHNGRVVLASALFKHSFRLSEFVAAFYPQRVNSSLARHLWGNVYFDTSTKQFVSFEQALPPNRRRAAVDFLLEPLYKVYSHVLGCPDRIALNRLLTPLHHDRRAKKMLKKSEIDRLTPTQLLTLVFSRIFPSGFRPIADAIAEHLPAPATVAAAHATTSGTALRDAIAACDPEGPLIAAVVKVVPSQLRRHRKPSATSPAAVRHSQVIVRILSGTLHVGEPLRILPSSAGDDYLEQSDTPTTTRWSNTEASDMFLWNPQRLHRLPRAFAGMTVLVDDLAPAVSAYGATVLSTRSYDSLTPAGVGAAQRRAALRLPIFEPFQWHLQSMCIVKMGLEPLLPTALPEMLAGEQLLARHNLGVRFTVESTGEHLLLGPGELRIDVTMRLLREDYACVEVRVTDPCVVFRESVSATSMTKCIGRSPNGRNQIEMLADPLSSHFLSSAIEEPAVPLPSLSSAEIEAQLRSQYDWEPTVAKALWAFGPETSRGTNVLVDSTLAVKVDKVHTLPAVKPAIVQGFRWASRHGPLCEEPLRGVRMQLLHCQVDPEPVHRGGGQLIPATRKAIHAAVALSGPVLLEPVYSSEILSPERYTPRLRAILGRRRGRIVRESAVPGTPLTAFQCQLPVVDSFGFETDIRVATQGQAYVTSQFDSWQQVPGNPADSSLVLPPLRAAPVEHLARDFVTKTRTRKGLDPSWSLTNTLDPAQIISLRQ